MDSASPCHAEAYNLAFAGVEIKSQPYVMAFFRRSLSMECFGFFIAAVAIGVVVFFLVLKPLADAQNEVKAAYLESLEKLKGDPHNPDLREATLLLGRTYAAAARNMKDMGGAVTIFDEVALMNDINAACARAGTKITLEEGQRKPSVEERLAKLEGLRSKQIISEQEYQSRRQQIVDEL